MAEIQRLTVEGAREATGWYTMPVAVLERPDIEPSHKFVYLLVEAAPGHTPMEYAKWMDLNVEAVRSGLNALFRAGVIEINDKLPYPRPATVEIDDEE